MKLEIHRFLFKHSKGSEHNPDWEFNTPKEAIDKFTSKGYGMHHWNIFIELDYGVQCMIPLEVFNDITDYWEE